ncbi:paired immunoglobulin-like type 2 receptor beta isoform X1 [Heptranchias perlo]|uniref:paired immunoglobulin-like type 2 receptor beta isoform X1 n=1 Tax=Heptranchias perlo TaxID=212740 RepID=UPI00355989FD
MGSALRLILLQLSIVLINGAEFHVIQLDHLEAEEGESITIPCSFTYKDWSRPRVMNILWTTALSNGEIIFNARTQFVHPDYRGRIEYLGNPIVENTGSIRIKQLKQSDSRTYFCKLDVRGDKIGISRTTPGTALTVRERIFHPTTGLLISSVTAPSTDAADRNSHKLGHGIILIIRSVLYLGMLAIAWLIGIYWLKRSEGSPDRRLREDSKQETRI